MSYLGIFFDKSGKILETYSASLSVNFGSLESKTEGACVAKFGGKSVMPGNKLRRKWPSKMVLKSCLRVTSSSCILNRWLVIDVAHWNQINICLNSNLITIIIIYNHPFCFSRLILFILFIIILIKWIYVHKIKRGNTYLQLLKQTNVCENYF